MNDYFSDNCSTCFNKVNASISGTTSFNSPSYFLVKKEGKRNIYFAPVGNQYNFGAYANGNTPRIIIMGITTSPSARDNFINDYIILRKDYDDAEALRRACIWNIFNSKNPTLQNRLTSILNISGIPSLFGLESNIAINRKLFQDYLSGAGDSGTNKLMNSIYFTQVICCSSCYGENGYKKPDFRDLGEFQGKCIKSQIDFISTFNQKVDLIISFGQGMDFVNRFDTLHIIKDKYIKHISISHPASGRGWNEIKNMESYGEKFIEHFNANYNDMGIKGKKTYRTQVINCYKQLCELKSYITQIK